MNLEPAWLQTMPFSASPGSECRAVEALLATSQSEPVADAPLTAICARTIMTVAKARRVRGR